MTIQIPEDALIAEGKVRDYLLKPQRKSDKSKYLSLAGYSREESWELLHDLRSQLLPGEGSLQERIAQGDLYELQGTLTGPNGRKLSIKTIWLRTWQNDWKFVTLFPNKREKS